jgi:hypothetical protein
MKPHTHTPGPWIIKRIHTPPVFDRGVLAIQPDIAVLQCPELDTASEANARLIAAAPEMLEALEAMCDGPLLIDDINASLQAREKAMYLYKQARAIIARATGRERGE